MDHNVYHATQCLLLLPYKLYTIYVYMICLDTTTILIKFPQAWILLQKKVFIFAEGNLLTCSFFYQSAKLPLYGKKKDSLANPHGLTSRPFSQDILYVLLSPGRRVASSTINITRRKTCQPTLLFSSCLINPESPPTARQHNVDIIKPRRVNIMLSRFYFMIPP